MRRLWRDTGVTYSDLQVADPSRMDAVRAEIADVTREQYTAFVFDREQIVAVADDVLRQSTAAADVQVWLAALIGFLGIGNSLIMSVLQRRREIGLLRAVGMSRRQLQATVAVEALLVGVAAGVLGMAGGLVGGWLPLRYFTFSVTGYLFPLMIPWSHMAVVFVAALLIGLLASLIPMRQAAQVPVLSAIAYE
jgi:putative ABC transport system permease protein